MSTPIRGSYAKGRVRRQEIIDTALELFARKGYDRTSVREIARLSGLSQAGLLHHFGTKEELFLAVLDQRDRRNERFYDEDERHRVTMEGLAHIVEHNAAEPGLVRLYVTMSAESTGEDNPARNFFTERYELLRNDIAADIRRRQASGHLAASVDPQSVATLLIAAADGLQIQWLLSPQSIDMAARLAELSAVLAPTSAVDVPKS